MCSDIMIPDSDIGIESEENLLKAEYWWYRRTLSIYFVQLLRWCNHKCYQRYLYEKAKTSFRNRKLFVLFRKLRGNIPTRLLSDRLLINALLYHKLVQKQTGLNYFLRFIQISRMIRHSFNKTTTRKKVEVRFFENIVKYSHLRRTRLRKLLAFRAPDVRQTLSILVSILQKKKQTKFQDMKAKRFFSFFHSKIYFGKMIVAN